MPIIRKDQLTPESPFAGVTSHPFVRAQTGAVALTVNELVIQPGAGVPLHIHPTHEEAMVILEGALEAKLGDQVSEVRPGTAIVAPRDVPHMLTNKGSAPARILAIFPTTAPQRKVL